MIKKQAAVFLDRDKTLIEDPGYLADPNEVKLLPGASDAVRRWNEAGYRVVVVTNQSGVARGLITEDQLDDIHTQLEMLLEEQEATVDAIYYCPYLDGPEAIVPKYRRDSTLRKPKPGMLLKAADDLDLDLSHSWMVGDRIEDIQAGLAAGCKTVLLTEATEQTSEVDADFVADTLLSASDIVLNGRNDAAEQPGAPDPPPDLTTPDTTAPVQRDQVLEVLKDVRSLLQQQQRESAQRDFSLARLGATLFQIVAVAILLWGLNAFISGDDAFAVTALSRFVLAGVIQLVALTLYVTDRSN